MKEILMKVKKERKNNSRQTASSLPSQNLLLLPPLLGSLLLLPHFPLRGLTGRILVILDHRWA